VTKVKGLVSLKREEEEVEEEGKDGVGKKTVFFFSFRINEEERKTNV
jgi:hypothetical protein